MNEKKDFITRFLTEPINNSIFGFRQMTKKFGYFEAIDGLLLRSIEEPLFYNILKRNYNLEVSGLEFFPKGYGTYGDGKNSGGAILISNFQSQLDPFIIGTSLMHYRKIIPKHVLPLSLGLDSLIMNLIRLNQAIFIRNTEIDEEALDMCRNALEEDKILVIYPEVKPNPGNGKMLPFTPDFVRLAYISGAPIIPMAVFGTDLVYGTKSKLMSLKGKIKVRFGKPIENKKLFSNARKLDHRTLEIVSKEVQRHVRNIWSGLCAEEEEKSEMINKNENRGAK
ncbi:MAG: lysophospholipid acyltransferase family protein [Promethearchaeota archaeon]